MPGHSRSKNGVASLAYVPGIHVFSDAVVKGFQFLLKSPAVMRGLDPRIHLLQK
jgi:hypothetical protein